MVPGLSAIRRNWLIIQNRQPEESAHSVPLKVLTPDESVRCYAQRHFGIPNSMLSKLPCQCQLYERQQQKIHHKPEHATYIEFRTDREEG